MPSSAVDFLAQVDELRADATAALDQSRRAEMGQFMSPVGVAKLMASMFSAPRDEVRLLDAGAGFGSLTAATVAVLLAREEPPSRIDVVAYEIDPTIVDYLGRTLELCAAACEMAGVAFEPHVEADDFLGAAVVTYCMGQRPYNCAILNPPYRKIQAQSEARELCRTLGFEASNLYAAFVGGATQLLEDGAEVVAITPRSFANGPYFRKFRGFLLNAISLRRLHVFDSRTTAFRDDDVLQENVIVYGVKSSVPPDSVAVTASEGPDDPARSRDVPWGRVVYAHDPEQFIHLIETDADDEVAERIGSFDNYLSDVGIAVSTGPVVDFRAPTFLRAGADATTVPLIYPTHMRHGTIEWPREQAKWNALVLSDDTRSLTVKKGNYVLVKRFTAKEERRRVVAAVFEASACDTARVGFENHLNFFHQNGEGLLLDLARGLAVYLNSTLVDIYFRQFSGHTQVNAADLRNIPYPPRDRLERLGTVIGTALLDQEAVDAAVERFLFSQK